MRVLGVVAVSLVVIGLAGCFRESGGLEDEGVLPLSANVAEPIVGCTYDYDPASGPREIASTAELMVRGTIGHGRRGIYPERKNGSEGRPQTDIIPIEADSVTLLGPKANRRQLREFEDDPVFYVEICAFAPPGRELKFDSLDGREVLAYLNRSTEGEPPGRLTYGHAGQPQPLFVEANLEGFLVDLASGKGVRDLELFQRYPGATLDDFLPSEPKFPPGR